MKTEPRFLCIDDHPASRAVLKLLLTGVLGYTDVRIVGCTADVVQRVGEAKLVFDAILLDLNMEPLDGFSLLAEFRRSSLYMDTPIIAFTASSTPEEIAQMQKAGFNGLIGKPLDPIQFPGLIRKVLHGEPVWEPV
jgi:CheY-like chemotaxis protein